MTRKQHHRDPVGTDEAPLYEEIIRAREWLVELGLVEYCGDTPDGQALWGLTKLGEQSGKQIVAAASVRLDKPPS